MVHKLQYIINRREWQYKQPLLHWGRTQDSNTWPNQKQRPPTTTKQRSHPTQKPVTWLSENDVKVQLICQLQHWKQPKPTGNARYLTPAVPSRLFDVIAFPLVVLLIRLSMLDVWRRTRSNCGSAKLKWAQAQEQVMQPDREISAVVYQIAQELPAKNMNHTACSSPGNKTKLD